MRSYKIGSIDLFAHSTNEHFQKDIKTKSKRGVYLYQLQAGSFSRMNKMSLLR